MEEHSAGHADQITRVCVCACQSLAFPIVLLHSELRDVDLDDPSCYAVTPYFRNINDVVYTSVRQCKDPLLRILCCLNIKHFIRDCKIRLSGLRNNIYSEVW